MKKILTSILAFLLIFSMVSCNFENPDNKEIDNHAEQTGNTDAQMVPIKKATKRRAKRIMTAKVKAEARMIPALPRRISLTITVPFILTVTTL